MLWTGSPEVPNRTVCYYKLEYMLSATLATLLLGPPTSIREYEILADRKQFFDLREQLASSRSVETEELYFRALVREKFNRLELANRDYERYLGLGGKKHAAVYRNMASNYARLGQYGKAEQTYRKLLREPKLPDRKDLENVAGLWGAIKTVPPQRVSFKGDTDTELTRDFNVTLDSNGQKLKFIFDTGANISTVSETYARKLGLKLYDSKVMVSGITGDFRAARLGVSKELRLGNVVVNNAVFLVFPDQDLYIKVAKLQLNGILGFPVISALRELTLTRSGRLIVPQKPTAKGLGNFALDGLTPIVLGLYGTRRFTFDFDSGANTSMLYPPFYKSLEHEVSKFEKMEHKFAGLGSAKVVQAFAGKNLKLSIGGQQATFPRIPILTEAPNENGETVCGNLGQDMIRQFESLTLNFEKMSLEFGAPLAK